MLLTIQMKIILLCVTTIQCYTSDRPANSTTGFLEAMMKKIQKERFGANRHDHNDLQTSMKENENQSEFNTFDNGTNNENAEKEEPPEFIITKQQLLTLYKAAVQKGANLNFGSLFKPKYPTKTSNVEPFKGGDEGVDPGETAPGYYYYFYPIKSFTNEHGDDMTDMMDETKDEDMMMGGHKSIEPLFVAMVGFLKVAMLFVITILFLPKFGALKSRRMVFKKGSEDFLKFTKLVTESIEGKDCSQRIACEVGQTVRNLRLGTKPFRVLEVLLPPALGKQLGVFRRAVIKREKCNRIECKRKNHNTSKKVNQSKERAS